MAVEVTSPLKTRVFKSREFGYELLILKGRKPNEKFNVYEGPDRFCDQTGRDRHPGRRYAEKWALARRRFTTEEEIRWPRSFGFTEVSKA